MRDLKEFSGTEWLRLTPLVHGFKQFRNDLVQAVFNRRHPAALDHFLHDAARFRDRDVLLVVAFEQPWVLDWLIRMARRHLKDAELLVFDNSRRPDARTGIERVCRERGVPCLAVPP